MGLSTLTPPAEEPVTLEELRAHLKADSTDDDTLITSLGVAARESVESFTRRAFITQTLLLTRRSFYSKDAARRCADGEFAGRQRGSAPLSIELPRPELIDVASVEYYDEDNVLRTLDEDMYHVVTDEVGGRIELAYGETWPTTYPRPDAVRVTYDVGYGAAADVPQALKLAILQTVTDWYELRGSLAVGTIVNKLPTHLETLLWQYRVMNFSTEQE